MKCFFSLLYNKEYTHWIEWNCTSLPAVLTLWWALESAELLSHTFTREAALLRPPRCHSLLTSYDMRFQIRKSLRDWTACDAEMKVWPRHTSDGSDQSWPDAVLQTQMCEYQLHDESEDFFRSRIPSDGGGKNPTTEKPPTLRANEIKRAVRFCMLMPAVGVDSI